MTAAHPRPTAHGFTLIEVLLALVIFGVIAVLAYRATATLTESEAQLASEAQRWRTLEALFTRFEADVRQAIPRPSRTGASSELPWVGATDAVGNSALTFTRAGSEFHVEPAMAGQRIGYRLRNGAIELAYWPHLDQPAALVPALYVMTEGVTAFRLEYLTDAGAWRERWPLLGEADVPRAVRVAVTLADHGVVERWFALR